MFIKIWIVLAAFLPFIAAISAKAGGKHFSNHQPREWLAQQTGWRARANAAQANTFEALPFFYAALLYAYFNSSNQELAQILVIVWLLLRLLYLLAYLFDKALLRSLIWFVALVCNISLLFV